MLLLDYQRQNPPLCSLPLRIISSSARSPGTAVAVDKTPASFSEPQTESKNSLKLKYSPIFIAAGLYGQTQPQSIDDSMHIRKRRDYQRIVTKNSNRCRGGRVSFVLSHWFLISYVKESLRTYHQAMQAKPPANRLLISIVFCNLGQRCVSNGQLVN